MLAGRYTKPALTVIALALSLVLPTQVFSQSEPVIGGIVTADIRVKYEGFRRELIMNTSAFYTTADKLGNDAITDEKSCDGLLSTVLSLRRLAGVFPEHAKLLGAGAAPERAEEFTNVFDSAQSLDKAFDSYLDSVFRLCFSFR